MKVRHSILDFPSNFNQVFALKLAQVFADVDRCLDESYRDGRHSLDERTIIIYGGVAVMLWLGGVSHLYRDATRDLDLVGTSSFRSSSSLFDNFKRMFLKSADGLLDEVQFSGRMFFMPPDYETNLVDISGALDLTFLRVLVLHPFDLMISKFARYADKDYEDIMALFKCFVAGENRDEFLNYFYVSYPYASDVEQRNFRDGLLDVVGVDFDELKINHDPSNL